MVGGGSVAGCQGSEGGTGSLNSGDCGYKNVDLWGGGARWGHIGVGVRSTVRGAGGGVCAPCRF